MLDISTFLRSYHPPSPNAPTVALVSDWFDSVGGIERFVECLGRIFSEQHINVVFITVSDWQTRTLPPFEIRCYSDPSTETEFQIPIYRLRYLTTGGPALWPPYLIAPRLAAIFQRHKVIAVHAHQTYAYLAHVSLLTAQLCGVPIRIFTDHSLHFLADPWGPNLLRLAGGLCNYITAPSPASLANTYIRAQCRPEKTVCVPNGVVFTRRRARSRCGSPPGSPVAIKHNCASSSESDEIAETTVVHNLLRIAPGTGTGRAGGPPAVAFVGRLTRRKGADTFVEALKVIAQEPKQTLVVHIFGDGGLLPAVLGLASHGWTVIDACRNPTPDYTTARAAAGAGVLAADSATASAAVAAVSDATTPHLLLVSHGMVPHPTLVAALPLMDVCIQASQTESFGIASLEALGLGCRLVATPVGVVAADDVLCSPEHGLVHILPHALPTPSELAACIHAAAACGPVSAESAAWCRRHIQSAYSWERCAASFMRLYAQTWRSQVYEESWRGTPLAPARGGLLDDAAAEATAQAAQETAAYTLQPFASMRCVVTLLSLFTLWVASAWRWVTRGAPVPHPDTRATWLPLQSGIEFAQHLERAADMLLPLSKAEGGFVEVSETGSDAEIEVMAM